MQSDLLTTSEAAAALGLTSRGVRWLIEIGQLPAVRIGRDWAIMARDVEMEQQRREEKNSRK